MKNNSHLFEPNIVEMESSICFPFQWKFCKSHYLYVKLLFDKLLKEFTNE